MKLDPMEAATLYLYAVDGESVAEIAVRQGVSERVVYRTLATCREKHEAANMAQAALRALHSGDLAYANRSRKRRASNNAERREVEKEQRRQRAEHRWRGIGRAWQAPLTEDDDDYDD